MIDVLPVTAKQILACLQARHADDPVAVANKMSFLNQFCDADFVAVSMAGVVTEFEIKVTRADFHRDRKKLRHAIYSGERRGRRPNRFWYVTAPGIISLEDLPSFAGWLEFDGAELRSRREAPVLCREKHDLTIILRLARAMRHRKTP